MTKVYINNSDGRIVLKVQNHTKSDVCTAISTLLYTLAENVIRAESKGKVEEFNYRLNPGDAFLNVKPKTGYFNDILNLFSMIKAGFELLVNQYPKHIELTAMGGV